jgi:putative inorganic carbon (HCO3(-)) transporter
MGRVATNKAAINMLKAHPFLGVGAGNFNDVFLYYTPPDLLQWVSEGKSIHNATLQIMSETGIMGLLVFSLLIIKSFVDVIKIKRYCQNNESLNLLNNIANGLGIGFWGYFIAIQFIPGAYYSSIYIFIPLIVVVKNIQKKHKEKIEEKKIEELKIEEVYSEQTMYIL